MEEFGMDLRPGGTISAETGQNSRCAFLAGGLINMGEGLPCTTGIGGFYGDGRGDEVSGLEEAFVTGAKGIRQGGLVQEV